MEAGGTYEIKCKAQNDVFTFWPIGDVHWGHKGCDEALLRQDVARVADDPKAFWLGMGDYIDAITYDDKRFDPHELKGRYRVEDLAELGNLQIREFAAEVAPIKDKCVGLLTGNHEEKFYRKTFNDFQGWLCTELGVPNFRYSCLTSVKFSWRGGKESRTLKIFAHHGAGASSTRGGAMNRIKAFVNDYQADLFLMGHVHNPIPPTEFPLICLSRDGKHLVKRSRYAAVTGTYLAGVTEGSTSYAEVKGFSPVPLGAMPFKIRPYTMDIGVLK